jgi:predicted nucleic acid-binding protein
MTVIVVDASVVATALLDDRADGASVRARLRESELSAPELVDLEVLSVIRRLLAAGQVTRDRAEQAIGDLDELPIQRAPHRPLISRCWELRDNVSPYDAAYVALAEALNTTLVTGDVRLAQAPGPTCDIEVLSPTH